QIRRVHDADVPSAAGAPLAPAAAALPSFFSPSSAFFSSLSVTAARPGDGAAVFPAAAAGSAVFSSAGVEC
ncbi:hypothetical protein LTR28_008708, partial [Elasticomyces elasticus]